MHLFVEKNCEGFSLIKYSGTSKKFVGSFSVCSINTILINKGVVLFSIDLVKSVATPHLKEHKS